VQKLVFLDPLLQSLFCDHSASMMGGRVADREKNHGPLLGQFWLIPSRILVVTLLTFQNDLGIDEVGSKAQSRFDSRRFLFTSATMKKSNLYNLLAEDALISGFARDR
jgi:hypothetical protein